MWLFVRSVTSNLFLNVTLAPVLQIINNTCMTLDSKSSLLNVCVSEDDRIMLGIQSRHPLQWEQRKQIPDPLKSPPWYKEIFIMNRYKKGFPGGTSGKESVCQSKRQREAGLIPGLGRSPGGGHGNPLQYSCLERIPMDKGAWGATDHRAAKSWIQMKWLRTCTHTYLKKKYTWKVTSIIKASIKLKAGYSILPQHTFCSHADTQTHTRTSRTKIKLNLWGGVTRMMSFCLFFIPTGGEEKPSDMKGTSYKYSSTNYGNRNQLLPAMDKSSQELCSLTSVYRQPAT